MTRLRPVIAMLCASALLAGAAFVRTPSADAAQPFVPVASPRRVLDTRSGASTFDGAFAGIGIREAGSTLRLRLGGRAGVPSTASAVALNITVTEPAQPGFVTLYPCDADRPVVSSVNIATAGQTIANAAVVRLSASGEACFFTLSRTHLVVDVSGYFPMGSFMPLASPVRLLDTRPGEQTSDTRFAGIGTLAGGSTLHLRVGGRSGIPEDAEAVFSNLAVTEPDAAGFATMYPCGAGQPNASNLNFTAGQTIANAAVSKIGRAGDVCVFTLARAHYILDVSGYFPAGTFRPLTAPARLLDTRLAGATIDGVGAGGGAVAARSARCISVAGRAGVADDAIAAVLTVTVTEPHDPGFLTVYPKGEHQPTASSLNYAPSQTIANTVIAKLGADGAVCLYSHAEAHYVVDIAGYFADDETSPPPPPPPGDTCTSPSGMPCYPAAVSGRHWIDDRGMPVPVKGVAVWTATQNLSNADITTLLEGVASSGFNAVLMAPFGLLWNLAPTNPQGNKYVNAAGEPYFATAPGGVAPSTPFAGEFGRAWSSVDHFMEEALRLGLSVFFTHYAGYGVDDSDPSSDTYGQAAEWLAASDADMVAYGAEVALRYPVGAYPNVVWVYSADRSFGPSSTVASRLDALAAGIHSVEGSARLAVAHPDKRDNGVFTSGLDQFGSGYSFVSGQLDANTLYSYAEDIATQFDSVFAERAVPVINIEPVYVHNSGNERGVVPALIGHAPEQGGATGQHVREQAWSTFLRGGIGIFHGDEDLWPTDSPYGLYSGGGDWRRVLDDPTGNHDVPFMWLGHLWDWLAAVDWADLQPDPFGVPQFLEVGTGSGSGRASSAFAPTLAAAYFPDARPVRVDTNVLTGPARVRIRWFDPTDGSYLVVTPSEAKSPDRVLTYPGANAFGSTDWVLVIDAAI